MCASLANAQALRWAPSRPRLLSDAYLPGMCVVRLLVLVWTGEGGAGARCVGAPGRRGGVASGAGAAR